jgi:hypothetical protein
MGENRFQMTERERLLMLKVADGFKGNFYILYNLKKHYPACEKILEYLLINRIVGEKLFKWIKVDLNNSPLTAWKFCLQKINSDKNRKVIYGIDFR